MEVNKQRIIFDTPNDTMPSDIIINTLEKNGVKDPYEGLLDENAIPKIVIVDNAAKDFFTKKISEEEMVLLFQDKIKVSKESASGIVNDIKKMLIPFAKLIAVPPDEKSTEKVPATVIPSEGEKSDIFPNIKPIENRETKPAPEAPSKKTRAPKGDKNMAPGITQPKGADRYREEI